MPCKYFALLLLGSLFFELESPFILTEIDLKIFLKKTYICRKKKEKGKMSVQFCTPGLLTHANLGYYPCEYST